MNKFETNDYKDFLEELQEHTFIEQIILDNLIKTNLINNIFENKDAVFVDYENDTFYFNYSSLKNDYLNLLEFNFFEYFLNKPEYIIFNQKEKSHFYIAYAYNKKNQHIISLYKNSETLKFYCHLFFQLDINYSQKYTSDILNIKEVHSITPYFFDSLSDQELHFNSISFAACNVPFIFSTISSNISYLISKFNFYKNDYYDLITPIKVKKMHILDKYYEPAILRFELKNF